MKSIKSIKTSVLLIAAMILTLTVNAQKVRLLDGNLSALKGVKKLNLEFDYSKMGVGKFATEEEYLKKKKADYDAKEPGRGNSFENSWKADRRNLFEPQFTELFTKYCDINIGDFPSEQYTMIFKTKYTEPGYNIYISKKNAEINGEVWIVETANRSHVIAKIEVLRCAGRAFGGNDYETGIRLKESYAVAGKGLGKFLSKKMD